MARKLMIALLLFLTFAGTAFCADEYRKAEGRINVSQQKQASFDVKEMTVFTLNIDGTKGIQQMWSPPNPRLKNSEVWPSFVHRGPSATVTVGKVGAVGEKKLYIFKTVEGQEISVMFNILQDPARHVKIVAAVSRSTLAAGESAELRLSGGVAPYVAVVQDANVVTEKINDSSFRIKYVKPNLMTKTMEVFITDSRWTKPDKITMTFQGNGVQVPPVAGKTRSEAEGALRAAGITSIKVAEVATQFHNQVGKVIQQDPSGNLWMERGKTVTLTVGGGGNVVPDMLLKPEAEAVNAVRKAGFVPEVSYYPEASSGAVGKVTKSEPMPYRVAQPGSKVVLMVGRASFDMPNVVGRPLADAKANLDLISRTKSLNLKYTVNARDTRNMAEDGKVFEQSPRAGAGLSPGTSVTLGAWKWVYEMPNFTGKTDREAFAALNQINSSRPGFIKLSATQTKDTPNPNDNDRIHDQNPKPGTIVQPGGTAIFYTYHYKAPAQTVKPPAQTTVVLPPAQTVQPPAFVVPNVVGMSERDAVQAMARARVGLLPTKHIVAGRIQMGRVIAQSVRGGTKTSDKVMLTVGR